MYDEIYRIPMVVAHPDHQGEGRAYSDFVYLQDIMPTILEIAGIAAPEGLDGVSLLPAVLGQGEGSAAADRDDVYCMLDHQFFPVNQRMVRTKTHQFTFNSGEIGELYDLVKDPYQLNNVYENLEYDIVRKELIHRMEGHMKRLNDPVYKWFKQIIGVY